MIKVNILFQVFLILLLFCTGCSHTNLSTTSTAVHQSIPSYHTDDHRALFDSLILSDRAKFSIGKMTTHSMNPLIQKGDYILIETLPSYSLHDVIVINSPHHNYPVCHRIVRVSGSRFVTQGDDNQFQDKFRPSSSNIIGKVVAIAKPSL